MIRPLRASSTSLPNSKWHTNNIRAFDRKRMAAIEGRFQAFRQLWKAWTLQGSKTQIGGVVPIHGVPRQTNQLPHSVTSAARAVGEIKLINSVFSENLLPVETKRQPEAAH